MSGADALQQTDAVSSQGNRLAYYAGATALAGCTFTALLMALAHLDAFELPGCGRGGGCGQAAQSQWGDLPGTGWPLSFVGFAYFQALLAAYLYSGGRLPPLLRAIVLLGAAVSVLLTAVMFAEDYLCGYCLTIHALNVAFAVGYEVRARMRTEAPEHAARRGGTVISFAGTLVLTTLLLAVVDHQASIAAEQATQEGLEQALDGAADVPAGDEEAAFAPGRYVLGPADAPVHVTIVSDYQCPSCQQIESQMRAMTAGRDDVALSMRHFPFCTDCNEHIDKTRHPNACRAAVAAEAAGIAGGADAFWQMHDWLFERGGSFTDAELLEFVATLPLDEAAFREALASEETAAIVREDADAADAAGLRFTPMVFINGRPIEIGQ